MMQRSTLHRGRFARRFFAAICFLAALQLTGARAVAAQRPQRLQVKIAAPVTPWIVVDQFGYLPMSEKIAVIRSPQQGFDAPSTFAPGAVYQLVDSTTGRVVLQQAPVAWQRGRIDPVSGDRIWWFDFSSVHSPGTYIVLDPMRQLRSPQFVIGPRVYQQVLVQAVRTFFYQRAGMVKSPQHAGLGWADAASHLGPLQDLQCRRYDAKSDRSTERDLHGGWYDAGDYNKYTAWTASYIIGLLKAYVASPAAFGDDTNIPESGNGVPDILDEVRWGMSWLERMQNDDGSVLSIVGLASASPPSAATGQSLYGPANTSATLASAAAYAYGAIVFKASANPAWRVYGAALQRRAERAYAWAENHPQVIFKNNDAATGSLGLGAGQQETDEHGRRMLRLTSACYLFELTGKVEFKAYFEQNFADVGIVASRYLNPFDEDQQEMLRHCAALPGIAAAVRQTTQQSFSAAFAAASWRQPRALGDAYMAELSQYTWGSNAIKAAQGLLVLGSLPSSDKVPAGSLRDVALGYLHYLHGVNPLSLVYMSNMGDFGATSSVRSFFHSWFTADSPRWSRVGASTYGPPPGFLTGGPNPGYKPDGCCPSHCRGQPKGVSCAVTALTPPLGQPPAKSYLDFNQGWPVNSWEVTENSNSYQVRYIRLLSRFVR